MNLSVRLRNDLNCGMWDSEYNRQLESQSRVDVVKRGLLGNIINPGSRGRGFGEISQIYLFNAWGKTGIADRR